MFYALRRRENAFWNIMPHLSLSRVKMQSLYLAHPFRLVLLFALIQLLRRVSPVIFDIFHASTFSHLRGSLGATDDRLLSRCKLTFGFHNQMAGGRKTTLKTPPFSEQWYMCACASSSGCTRGVRTATAPPNETESKNPSTPCRFAFFSVRIWIF